MFEGEILDSSEEFAVVMERKIRYNIVNPEMVFLMIDIVM